MFRVLRLDHQPPAASEGPDAVAPPAPGEMLWIDLQAFTEAELNVLAERFKFHPLAIEDCLQPSLRAKLDEYDDYMFIVAHSFAYNNPGQPQVSFGEVDAFVGKNYLVTVHQQPVAALEVVWKRFVAAAGPPQHGVDFIYYLIIDALVDEIFPVIDQLSDQIEDAEARILRDPRGHDLGKLLTIKRTLIAVRRVLSPERDVLAILLRRVDALIDEKTAFYFRDVYDHLVRAYEEIDVERDLLGNAMDAYHSVVANRANEIVKRLTIVASIFLPLGFLSGFFGQNFQQLPFSSDRLFAGAMAAYVVLPVAMFFYFRRWKWI
jgi:magnesium transporter